MAKKDELIDMSIPVPSGTYVVYVEKVESARTKVKTDHKTGAQKGNDPMAVFSLQVLAPDVVETPAGPAQAAGRKLTWYLAFTPRNATPVKQAELLLGRELPNEYDEVADIIDPLAQLKGTVFEAELVSEPYYKTDTGKWDGNIIKGEDGQPIVAGYRLQFKAPKSALQPLPAGMNVQPF